MRNRITWMDTLRGAAILLLLLWHSSSVPERYGFEMPSWLFLLNEAFQPWRMPTLMFLSGMLLAASLKKPRSSYYTGKVKNLLWPYLLWAAVYLALYPGFGESITDPVSWFGAGYLWFILYLFIYYLIAPLVVKVPWWVTLPAFAVGALVIPHPSPQQILYFAIFFFSGHYFREVTRWATTAKTGWFVLGLVLVAAFTTVSLILSAGIGTHFFRFEVYTVPAVVVLILVSVRIVSGVSARWGGTEPTRTVTWIGRTSVVFYLTHVPIMHGVCALLLLVGDLNLSAVALCLVASISIGMVLARFNESPAISWMFRMPSFRRATSTAAMKPDAERTAAY